MPRTALSRSRIAAMCGPIRGCCAMTVASTLPICQPSARSVVDDGPQQVQAVGAGPALVGRREPLADVAAGRRPEQRVDDGVDQRVAVRVAGQAGLVGISTPPSISRRPGARAWTSSPIPTRGRLHDVAAPGPSLWAQGRRRARAASSARADLQVVRAW